MKKILLALLLLIACIFLASCNQTPPEPPAEENTVVITWKDENGEVLKTENVKIGTVPSFNYDKADTAEWDFTVDGFSATLGGEVLASIPAASEDATYFASVSKTKRTYSVTFNTYGGTQITSLTKEYGETVEIPDAPTKSGFKFVGWCTDSNCNTAAEFPITVTKNIELHAKWNEKIDLLELLKALLTDYESSPYSYLPETMTPAYTANNIPKSITAPDYTSFVNLNNIYSGGFGEQWQMVLDNIEQSMSFYNILSIIEGVFTASVTSFNNYLDSNTDDTAHHNFKHGIYNVTIDFDGETLSYVLDYTDDFLIFGTQTAQIALSTNIDTTKKNVRIQIGDANALAYTQSENSYEFGIRYLGVRRAYFKIERDEDGNSVGNISEFLTVSSIESQSSADFYITEDYVTCVGNKADGFIGSTGYISEVYSVDSGKLLGYEVKETISKIEYNTLWFNLDDIGGIQSIKYIPATSETPSALYLNGSNTEFQSKTVGGLSLKALSRRYDIEFRTQYFYSYDNATDKYTKIALSVPMMFIQEECLSDFTSDVKSENSSLNLYVNTNSNDLEFIQSEYDTKIDMFIINKDLCDIEFILDFIGTKITF